MKRVFVTFALCVATLLPATGRMQRRPASSPTSVVDLRADCLLGGTIDGRFVKDAAISKVLRGGERYRFFSLTGPIGEGTGAKPQPLGDVCQETMQIQFEPKPERGVAINSPWNPMPRIPSVIANNNPTYRAAVATFLKSRGIARPNVKIVKAVKIDLDGDGSDEVVINATNYRGGLSSDSHAGDYSLVIVRKVVAGSVATIQVAGEFYPKFRDFNAPSEYSISGIVDADGDGKMEIVVFSMYYEGHASALYRIEGNRAIEALVCGCGV